MPAPAEAPAAAAAELVFREEPAETAAQAAQRPDVPPQTRREARQTYPAAQPARERAGERNAAEEIKGPRAAAAAPRGTEDHGSVPSVTGPETAGEPARTAREIPETGRPFTAGTQADGIRDEIPQERGAAGETPQTAIPAQEEPQTAAPAELVFQNEMKAANPAAPQAAIPQQTQREARQAQAAAQPARERAEERNAAAESREPRAAVVPGGTEIPAEEIPAAEPGRAAIPAQEGPQNAAAPAELVYREKAEELQQSARTAPQDALPAQPRREARQTSPEERPTPERAYERRAAEENGETGTAKDAAGEAAARLAVPAQPEALSGTPAQLVFREETGETPPRGAEAPAAALPVRIVPPDAAARQTAARTASESGRPAQRAVRQTLRDIRVAAPHDAEPEPYAGKTERIAEAVPAPEPAQTPGQTELFFAETPKTDARAAEEAAARPTEKPARAEKTERMPAWAKELLEQSGVTDSVQQADVFRSAESAARSGRQITWSAPAMPNPVMKANEDRSGPADLMFREHREAAETPYRPQISDAELQRTADRVYRMIEERLRRELRRSGR